MLWTVKDRSERFTRPWAESRRQSQLRCGVPDQAVGQTANGRRTGLRSSASTDEKNVPSPSANMLILRIVNLGTIAETVAVLVFFQAEDGIRDLTVTGVQTCALPILRRRSWSSISSRHSPERTRKSSCSSSPW